MKWSDAKTFWAETWRSIILASVGAGAAFFILGPHEDMNKKLLEMKTDVVNEYLRSSYRYSSEIYNVLTGEKGYGDIQKEFDKYKSDGALLSIYFVDHDKVITKVDSAVILSDTLYERCKAGIVTLDSLKALRQEIKLYHQEVGRLALKKIGFFNSGSFFGS